MMCLIASELEPAREETDKSILSICRSSLMNNDGQVSMAEEILPRQGLIILTALILEFEIGRIGS